MLPMLVFDIVIPRGLLFTYASYKKNKKKRKFYRKTKRTLLRQIIETNTYFFAVCYSCYIFNIHVL